MQQLLHELRRLEAELHHPGAPCSRERLEQLLHPGFHEVGKSGRHYTRETVITHLTSAAAQPAVESDNYAVQVLGDACALLTYRSADRLPDNTIVRVALRCSVWIRGARGWQLVYHQGTPAPE